MTNATVFVPKRAAIIGTQVPLITNLTIDHFPFQSFLEMTEIIGQTLRTNQRDGLGMVKVSGQIPHNNNGTIYFPDTNYILVMLPRQSRCNPIYLGVEEDKLSEVGIMIEELVRNCFSLLIESESAFLSEDNEVQAHTRRSFTVKAADLHVYFIKIEQLKEDVREYIESRREQAKAAAQQQ